MTSSAVGSVVSYQTEATKRYTAMLEKMKEDIVGYLFHPAAQADDFMG
jgi:hypothetical protein